MPKPRKEAEDSNSISSSDDDNNVIKNVDFLKYLQNANKKSCSSKGCSDDSCKKNKKSKVVEVEEEEEEEEVEEEDEDDEEEEEEEDDEDDEEEEDDDIQDMSLYHILNNFLVDEENTSVATSLSNIAKELHKLNKNIKKFSQ